MTWGCSERARDLVAVFIRAQKYSFAHSRNRHAHAHHRACVLNRYDHRLRDLVYATADSTIARINGAPRSTAARWIKHKPKAIVSVQQFAPNPPQLLQELQQEAVRLQAQIAKLRSLLRLIFLILRLSGFKLERYRIPDPKNKTKLI